MANFSPLQAQNFSLSGSGCSIGDTVLNLKSFKDILGVNISMSDLGLISYITIEPGNGTQEEQISFTGVTQNSDGSAQLTGVKTVLFKEPYTETSGIRVTHPGSVIAVLSNTAGFYNKFGALANDEAITGNWTVLTGAPIAAGGITSKAYVLSVVSGGPVTTDQVIVSGTAGENLTVAKVVYLKADGKWYTASSATAATSLNAQLGIIQGTVTTGNNCSILIWGVDKNQTGLVAGTTYYLSTAGALSTSVGTIPISIGEALAADQLQFYPGFTTGGATASITGKAGMIPIASSGSSILDTSWLPVVATASALTLIPQSAIAGTPYFSKVMSVNTTMFVGQVVVPFTITVNKVTIRSGDAVTVNGTLDISLYSEDGQTRLFSVTTPTVSAASTLYTTAVSSVVVVPGIYYIAINTNSTTNVEIANWSLNAGPFSATEGLPTDVASEPLMQGTVTITAGTPPATITPTSIAELINATLISRWDN